MAEFNLDYYNNVDSYSDGDIEDEILAYVKEGGTFDELPLEKRNYHFLYHLSDLRQNILNWYPFAPNSQVLEIGSGCGAITEALCRGSEKVVSVELSKRRASINYERNKKYENLHIYVGNLNDMVFNERFDYIVLNGVFEYAISFTKDSNPYVLFLKNALRFLKEDGKILIAIENKFGLKYFAGAPEDHMGQYFAGVNGYEENDAVRTFTKSEIKDILGEAGLWNTKFYYPYPDYKFPNEIFTDESFKGFGYGRDYYNLNSHRFELFHEAYVAEKLAQEGVADVFANSFLIEATRESIPCDRNVIYAKINCDRNEQFRIITSIEQSEDGLRVTKSAVNEKSVAHIENIYQISRESAASSPKVKNVPTTLEAGKVSYRYMSKSNLDQRIEGLIEREDIGSVLAELKKFFDIVFAEKEKQFYDTEEFRNIFGDKKLCQENSEKRFCINPANIDLICSNVFCNEDGSYEVIDCEWVFPMNIPVDFIVWRCVNELYTQHPELQKLMKAEELLHEFDITQEEAAVYREWTLHFVNEYVGTGTLESYHIPKTTISLNDIEKHILHRTHMESYLYVDTGNGYSEENKILAESDLVEDGFCLHFSCEKAVHQTEGLLARSLRWDPIEGSLCKLQVESCECNGEKVQLKAVGSELSDGDCSCGLWDVFLNGDPQYTFEVNSVKLHDVVIKGKIVFYNETEGIAEFRRHLDQVYSDIQQLGRRIDEKEDTIRHRDTHIQELNHMLEEKQQQIERCDKEKNCLENTISEKDRQILQINDMLEEKSSSLDQLEAQMYHITHTKGYLALEKARHIKQALLFWKK